MSFVVNTNLTDIECEIVNCALCGSDSSESIAKGFDYEYWTSKKEFALVRCTHCGHCYLNPRPPKEASLQIYPSYYYTLDGRHEKKSSHIISFLKGIIVQKRLSFFKQYLRKPISILEIGSGDCSLLITLKTKFPQVRCVGVDLNFSETQRTECENLNIALIEGAIEDVTLPDNEYDLVIMNQLIEHLWHPVKVLQNIHRSLSPGGMVSIETVNLEGYDRFFFKESCWGGYYFPRHMHLFSFDTLRKLLEQTEFKIIKQHSLLAPIVWTFSFHALFCRTPEQSKSLLSSFFSDRNPLCLFLFTCLDIVAISIGLTTSNQKIIACKISNIAVQESSRSQEVS